MLKPQSQETPVMILVSYVFNSPMLIPWSVVKNILNQELSESLKKETTDSGCK
jgi:hypothetical protein